MSKKSWIPEIQFCNWIWMSTIHALTNSQDIYVISHMNRKENGWNKICNFINAFSQLCQISVVISFMKAEVLFAFLENMYAEISMWCKFIERCHDTKKKKKKKSSRLSPSSLDIVSGCVNHVIWLQTLQFLHLPCWKLLGAIRFPTFRHIIINFNKLYAVRKLLFQRDRP